MKAKFNFGDGGLKGFLFLHVEKLIGGVVVALVLALLFLGFTNMSRNSLKEITPQGLASLAQNAQGNIDRNTWTEVAKAKGLEPPTYESRVPPRDIQPGGYQVNLPWDPPLWPSLHKRKEPRWAKPLFVEATAGYGTLAMNEGEDPILSELERDRLLKAREEALKAAAAAKQPAPSPANPLQPGERPRLAGPGGRGLDFIRGGQPGAVPGMGGMAHSLLPDSGNYYTAPPSAVALGTYFVSVRALVPVQEQTRYFRDALGDAVGFDPTRDAPNYLGYWIERQTDEGGWVRISWQRAFKQKFAGNPQEIADARYIHPKLTEALPPLVQRDLTPLAIHAKVPTEAARTQALAAENALDAPAPEGKEGEPKPETDFFDPAERAPGGAAGVNPEIGARPPPDIRGPGEGGRAGLAGGVTREAQAEFALLRFFDFEVKPGHSYRYRVKLVLEDPNNPRRDTVAAGRPGNEEGKRSIPLQWLDDKELERIRKLENPATAADPNAAKPHLVESPESDASESVTVPGTRHIYAGEVTQPKYAGPGYEPSAKLLIVVWDKDKAVEVPAEIDVQRGSLVDFVQDADVVHPIQNSAQQLPKYDFRTSAVVLDIRGSEPLTDDRRNPMLALGEVLLVDPDGKLVAQNELDDKKVYRRYRAENEAATPKNAVPGAQGAPLDAAGALEGILNPGAGPGRRPPEGPAPRGKRGVDR